MVGLVLSSTTMIHYDDNTKQVINNDARAKQKCSQPIEPHVSRCSQSAVNRLHLDHGADGSERQWLGVVIQYDGNTKPRINSDALGAGKHGTSTKRKRKL